QRPHDAGAEDAEEVSHPERVPGHDGPWAEEDRLMSQPTPAPYQITQADVDHAVHLLNQGNTLAAVQSRLVARGVPPEAATDLLDELFLLNAGNSPDEVKRLLAEKGLERRAADAVVDDLLTRHRAAQQQRANGAEGMVGRVLLRLLGGIVFVLGIGL